MITRRNLFTAMSRSWLGLMALRVLGKAVPDIEAVLGEEVAYAQNGYEDYEGFVLIQSGLPLPSGVVDSYGPPSGCNPNLDSGQTGAIVTEYSTVQQLATATGISVYCLGTIPSNLAIQRIFRTKNESNDSLYSATVDYKDVSSSSDAVALSIITVADYAQPYPLWYSDADDAGGDLVKVSYTPNPGIELGPDSNSLATWPYSVLWIESDRLIMIHTNSSIVGSGQTVVGYLAEVSP